jgi:mono/diheme cytochrome c family protein
LRGLQVEPAPVSEPIGSRSNTLRLNIVNVAQGHRLTRDCGVACRVTCLVMCLGGALLTLALGTAAAQDAQLDKAPASARAAKNPYSGKPDAVAAGSKVYAANCTKCHGLDAKGTGMVPSLLKGTTQSASEGVLFWFVTHGNIDDGMPAWGKLSVKQRWQVVSFIKSLGAAEKTPEDFAKP